MRLLWQWIRALLDRGPYEELNAACAELIFAPTDAARHQAVGRLKKAYQETLVPWEARSETVPSEQYLAVFNLAAACRVCASVDPAFAKKLARHLDVLQDSRYISDDGDSSHPFTDLAVERPLNNAHPAYILAWLERSFPQRADFYGRTHAPYSVQLFQHRVNEFLPLQQPGEDLAAKFNPVVT